jgi:FlaA1/EpsC-like NDP-sugar epimerase
MLARELGDAHKARVVGFLDDNPRVRRRRIQGIAVVGALDEADRAISSSHPDEILVTIPEAQQAHLDAVVRAAEDAGIPCRFVQRSTQYSPSRPAEISLP